MQQKSNFKAQKVKTKVRFTSLDTAAMVAQLQTLVGLRVSNIYDVSPTTYLLKLARSQQKYHLLIENGVRFHLTSETPDKKRLPSGFTMKFRKFLRSKRLESIRQVGVERVVVLSFGSEAFANHLILQLYSQGNIILTDQNYRIIQCIRSHEFTDKIKTAIGEIYPFEHAANIYLQNISISSEALSNVLARNQEKAVEANKKKGKTGKEQGKNVVAKVKDLVFQLIPCLFPQVIDHILTLNKIDGELKVQSEAEKQITLKGATYCFQFLKNFLGCKQKGHLYGKGDQYFQFSPFPNCKLSQYMHKQSVTFDEAVAQYFSKYVRSAHQEEEAFEEIAWKKYEQIKKDQEERVHRLIQEQETYGGKAQLIEKNIQDVEAILKIISTMENHGYSWEAMERMIAESRKTGDPLANMIHSLTPVKRIVTVLLSDTEADEPDLCPLTPVELHADYNAYTNATLYYESKKKQQQKEARTREASEQVLKLAEKDALKKIEKKKNQILLKAVPSRKAMWFEKFYWFVTSDGWLILSGRDSHQNELLVKRYMRPGDLYMHSDYGGAASTIIKGPPKSGIAPLATLEEAAVFTVCRSKAWDTKIISSAWWVYHDQVSKSAPTGEYLPTGSFMIRGKRNFLHPNRMEMGLTLLYRLDNQSAERRKEHREALLGEIQEEPIAEMRRQESSEVEDQEYAIIDLQAEARQARDKKKQKNQKPEAKANKQPEFVKQSSKQGIQEDEPSASEEESDQDEYKDKRKREQLKDPKRKEISKGEKEEQSQKHKNRNKKKLKKLEKYMQEQDEEERKLILKMLGAKEMKHIQPSEQEEREKGKQQKQVKKKGIEKYLDIKGQKQQENALDTEKILFLKNKKQGIATAQSKNQSQQPIENNKNQDQKASDQASHHPDTKQLPIQSKQPQRSTEQQKLETQKEEAYPPEIASPETAENRQFKEEPDEPDSEEEPKQNDNKPEEVEEEPVDEKVMDSELAELPRLVGRLNAQDKWEVMIPMCAPYSSIKDNTFKVKLLPGALKKGKAARSIMSYFLSGEVAEQERAFVRGVPEQEVINALIGNVKLGGAGLLKLQQKVKAQKKEKRKDQDRKAKGE